MADTLYDIAEQFRQQILSSPEKQKTAAEFFSAHGHAVKEEDVIVLDDGTPVIRDDPGRNFDRHQLQQLKDEISGQLSLFSEEDMPRKVEGRGTARNGEEGSGRDARKVRNVSRRHNPILRDGVSAYYSPETGWNGKEQPPWTVKGAWDRFGFVDFLGMQVRSPKDVAQMFSIYRNPLLEYFHIVLLKDGRIVHQTAMTSGLSGIVRIVPSGGYDKVNEEINKIDYDQAYLIHNHPSGNVSPSDDDIGVTCGFIIRVLGERFRGHIILDHGTFSLLETSSFPPERYSDITITHYAYKPHKIPGIKRKYGRFSSPMDVARFVFDTHTKDDALLYLDNEHNILQIAPFNVDDYDPATLMKMMKENFARNSIIIVTSEGSFNRMIDRIRDFSDVDDGRQPLLDCMLVNEKTKEYTSMLERGWLRHLNWQSYMAKQSDVSYTWDENISDHPKQGYLFEKTPSYRAENRVFHPNWRIQQEYEKRVASCAKGEIVQIRRDSPFLEALGFQNGSMIVSDRVIEGARKDSAKSDILKKLPNIVSDPVAVIDTKRRTGTDNPHNYMLFAYNMLVRGIPETVGVLVEPVKGKMRTEYKVQALFTPEEITRDGNRLFSECAKNNQFIYAEAHKPFFIIHDKSRTQGDEIQTTRILLPESIPDKGEIAERCWQMKMAKEKARR